MGSAIMLIADNQKYWALFYNRDLARKKKFLISDGIFYSCRNPNYFGEMVIYAAFATLCPGSWDNGWSWVPWGHLIFTWSTVFLAQIYMKETSFSRKPGWEEYRSRSWMFLFKPW